MIVSRRRDSPQAALGSIRNDVPYGLRLYADAELVSFSRICCPNALEYTTDGEIVIGGKALQPRPRFYVRVRRRCGVSVGAPFATLQNQVGPFASSDDGKTTPRAALVRDGPTEENGCRVDAIPVAELIWSFVESSSDITEL